MGRHKMTYEEMVDLVKGHQYKAPDGWEFIEESLEFSQELSKLPEYKAPDNLWEGIEASLEVETATSQPDLSHKYLKYLKWAGTIILLLTLMIVYLLSNKSSAVSEYQYRSETEQMASLDNRGLQIDENLDDVLMYIHANEFIFSSDELEKFENQLLELKAAIKAIQEMKEKYGQDATSDKLLARIERDKSDLLKAMIAATS